MDAKTAKELCLENLKNESRNIEIYNGGAFHRIDESVKIAAKSGLRGVNVTLIDILDPSKYDLICFIYKERGFDVTPARSCQNFKRTYFESGLLEKQTAIIDGISLYW